SPRNALLSAAALLPVNMANLAAALAAPLAANRTSRDSCVPSRKRAVYMGRLSASSVTITGLLKSVVVWLVSISCKSLSHVLIMLFSVWVLPAVAQKLVSWLLTDILLSTVLAQIFPQCKFVLVMLCRCVKAPAKRPISKNWQILQRSAMLL